MRIIDKNTDFYDYWQNVYRDISFTFDRRNSFLLTKEIVCNNLDRDGYYNWQTKQREPRKFNYALLQICNTFWLFLIEATNVEKENGFFRIKDYDIELLATWRDFNKPRKLCDFKIISSVNYYYIRDKETAYKKVNDFIKDIVINNYKVKKSLDTYSIRKADEWIKKDIPILKACGVANCVDSQEMYLAFEEYFSLEKTASERREPIGTTDIDKVESHGFDKKISFRGKQK